jgi:hypothetical protein
MDVTIIKQEKVEYEIHVGSKWILVQHQDMLQLANKLYATVGVQVIKTELIKP